MHRFLQNLRSGAAFAWVCDSSLLGPLGIAALLAESKSEGPGFEPRTNRSNRTRNPVIADDSSGGNQSRANTLSCSGTGRSASFMIPVIHAGDVAVSRAISE